MIKQSVIVKCDGGHKLRVSTTLFNKIENDPRLDDNDIEEMHETGVIPSEYCPYCEAEQRKNSRGS